MFFFSDALSSCLYISVSLKNDLLKQHESLNGTYIWKKGDGQPTWKSLKLHGESSTYLDTNVIWKKSKDYKLNGQLVNGDWMIGKKGETKIAKIRGSSSTGKCNRPDRCQMWSYYKKIGNNDWTKFKPSIASGINVTCIKGNKYFSRGQQ